MSDSALTRTVDEWTASAMVASGYLVRLYRVLGDPRQASHALQAAGPWEERAQRLSLHSRIAALQTVFVAEHPEETDGEARAWQILIEAQAGLSAFYSMVEDHEKGKSLRGSKTGTAKAFHQSIRGYRTAFPEEMTGPGIEMAIRSAADSCVRSFAFNLDEASEEERRELRQNLHASILEALIQAAETNQVL